MLEVWGRPYSSNVIPVIWTAAEVGVEWELKLAGGSFGQLDTPEFAAMNPNRMIPTIRDDDFALWESNAIIRYLCDERRDPALVALHAAEAARVLPILEAHLGSRAFVLGDQFTMADIPLGCVAYRYFSIDIERPSFPNIEAWYQRLQQRPAYERHVMRFFGTNPTEWQALERASAEDAKKGE